MPSLLLVVNVSVRVTDEGFPGGTWTDGRGAACGGCVGRSRARSRRRRSRTDISGWVTKLCTCRTLAEGLPARARACVWSLFLVPLPHSPVLFWGGQDMNVMRGSVRMNKRAQCRGVEGGSGDARRGPTESFIFTHKHAHAHL